MSNALIDNETTIADVRPPKRRLKRLILLVVVPFHALSRRYYAHRQSCNGK